jgi:nucleoside 2-deoxyribosyltransferase
MTGPKPFCFVLMPFSEDFNNVYTYAIKGACDEAVVYCERVDEQIYEGTVLERIYNQIAKSDVIVGDMTGMNPNVFYEVGYAHALEKRVVLLTQNADHIPFDLKHYPHIVYSKNDIAALQTELTKRLKVMAFAAPNSKKYEIGLDLYLAHEALSSVV